VTHPQSQGLIGKVESEFEYNRAKLLESMGAEVRNVISSYDKTEEARQLANEVRLPPSTSAAGCSQCEVCVHALRVLTTELTSGANGDLLDGCHRSDGRGRGLPRGRLSPRLYGTTSSAHATRPQR
jgi:hypothetical protein